jgi:hypothetical protein
MARSAVRTPAVPAVPCRVRCFCSSWVVSPRCLNGCKECGGRCHACGGELRPYDEVAKEWGLT